MRTEQAQIEGLKLIQRALYKQGWRQVPPVVIGLGDVPALPLSGAQIVFASGGYDIWDDRGPTTIDMTLDQVLSWASTWRA